jgi:hypothetical protein
MQILDELIFVAVDDFNRTLPDERKLAKSPSSPLLDAGAILDSIEIASLLISVEELLLDMTGVKVSLLSKSTLEDPARPLANLGNLAGYIERFTAAS